MPEKATTRTYTLYGCGHARFAAPEVPPGNYKVVFYISVIVTSMLKDSLLKEEISMQLGTMRLTAGTLRDEA
jgi:hypothetical protein